MAETSEADSAGAKLVFVYNVDGTPMALLRDLYQSVTTGSTECRLCDVTFGTLLKKPEWSEFIRSLPIPAEFRLRSTFKRRYPAFRDRSFPAVFLVRDGEPREVISAAELNGAADLAALRALVSNLKLHPLRPAPGPTE
jgi:hypothetical protein